MRICYFADGESIHVIRWCKYFASLGNEVHLISFKNVAIENVQTHFIDTGSIAVKGGNWKVLLKYRKVKKILKQIRPQIFHSHYATSYGVTGAMCGFHPYLITALGTDVLISPQQSKIYKLLLQYAFSKTDWITAMSDHMKSAIESLGVNPEKISTVPFGIDPDVFNDADRKLIPGKFIITSTRNFEPVYNIPHLIYAFAKAKQANAAIHLNLIGTGSLQKEIKTLVHEKGLDDDVTFYGKISQSKIAEVLNQSHVFVSTSLSDGNNISLNEAMACGAFCIATNIPANTQWITDGKNGFLVNINDVETLSSLMLQAIQNFDALQSVAIPFNKKMISEKAIWSVNMKKVEEKYESLILKK
ncbi:capsular polysaccharide biosynthesis protein [Bacteroidota bacterium]|nr:capsular polysaccharide biosynthesis protein [Bacteroidota bacterium]